MAWYDALKGIIPGYDFAEARSANSGQGSGGAKNFLEDPAGDILGTNTQGLQGISNTLHGNPQAVINAFNDAMAKASQSGHEAKDYLTAQKANTLRAYGPIQHIYQNLYGSQGMTPFTVPGYTGQGQPQPQPGAISAGFGAH
jgi:hypothetical protein